MSEFEIVDVTEGDRLMSQKEAAARLGTNQAFIKRLLDTGLLPCIRFGRYARISVNEQLKNAPGTASRAGRISAILFARHADIFAKAMRENGAADYTALDYLKQHQVVFNQDLNGGMNQDTSNGIIKYQDNAAEASAKLFSQEAIPVEANIVVSEDKRVTEAAVNAFSEKYPSGIEVNTPIGKVTISRRGIRNSLNHKCYQAKMDSVLSLGEGVKNMTYIGSARDFDGKPITNHFFAYPIEYNNERRYVLCRIKHADSGRPSFYVHDVIPENDIQKKSQSVKYAAHVDESTRDLRGSALYSYILTEFYRKGKEKNQNIFSQMAGEETYKKEHGSERLTPPNGAVPDSNHVPYSFSIQDLVERVKNTKATSEMKQTRHQSPTRSFTDGFVTSIIPTEEDLVKLKNKNIFNQMAGERAAANLDIGQAGLLAKLREAQSMNDTVEEIYRQTGWVLGADGKWRFEIPDNLDAVDYSVLHENGEAKLSEVYDNPKLYMAYPQLQDIPVVMENGMENSAGSTNGLRIRLAPKAGKTTLLHEIQHIIQGYENFASGGSPDSVINRIEDRAYSLKKTIADGFKNDTGDVFRLLEDYDNAKQGMVRAMRSRKRGEAAQLKGLMQELKGKIADSCRNPKDVDNVISTYYERKMLNDILTEYRNTPSDERPAMREELYRQLAGEQEAVATEKRALSTDGQTMPRPHGYDAVVVFDKKSIALSTDRIIEYPDNAAEASAKLFSQEAIPVESKAVVANGSGAISAGVAAFSAKYPSGIKVETPIGKVTISRRGIRNSLNHKCFQAKMDSVLSLDEGTKRMVYIGSIRDFTGKAVTNHFFAYPIQYENKRMYVFCRVRHADSGIPSFYIHDVISEEELQKESRSLKDAAQIRDLRGTTLYMHILTEFQRKSKEKISDSLLTRAAADKQEVPRGIALYASILSDYVAKVDSQSAHRH